MSEPLVRFERAALGYGGVPVLEGVELEIRRGEAWGFVGPNGSGKSTLVRAMLGLERPLRGAIAGTARFGYVPQKERLDPVFPLTAYAVAEMGAYRKPEPLARLRGIDHAPLVRRRLKECGALELAGRMYSELSGGQRQRVLLARALAAEPEVLVLDEPLEGVDAAAHDAILGLLRRLNGEGMTIVLVGHRMGEALELLSRVARFGDGRVRPGTPKGADE